MSRHLVSADSILDDSARMACKALSKSMLPQAFYLAGGTGLAIQLKHRISLDLDFFTIHPSERLDLTFVSSALERAVPRDKLSLVTSQIDQSTWTIGTTKVSFIAYPFSLLDEPLDGSLISGSSAGLRVATVRDIACMKAYALGRRAVFRDYVDLYFIFRSTGISLDSLVRDCERKFVLGGQRVFSTKLFLEQLVYTEDIQDRDAALRLLPKEDETTEERICRFLREAVDHYLQRELGGTGGERS